MTPTKDYVILVDGKPYFFVANPESIAIVKEEAARRYPAAKIEVAIFTVEPYEAPASDDCK